MSDFSFAPVSLSAALCFCNSDSLRLAACLTSLASQTCPQLEILLIDDSPAGKLDTESEAVLRRFLDSDIRFRYVSHGENRGLLEARRSSVLEARGNYLFWIDDDDLLASPYALAELAKAAASNGADIVQGLYEAVDLGGSNEALVRAHNSFAKGMTMGTYEAKDNLLDFMFTRQQTALFAWGKLVRREIAQRAFAEIPPLYCVMQEDLLLNFFIASLAQSYYGQNTLVYQYQVGEGVSTGTKTVSLAEFEKKYLTTEVFTLIFDYLHSSRAEPALQKTMQKHLYTSIRTSLQRIKKNIASSEQEQARRLLCDSWGEKIVETVEAAMAQT